MPEKDRKPAEGIDSNNQRVQESSGSDLQGSLEELAMQHARHALKMVSVNLPWLSGLCHQVKLKVDDRFSVAAITKSGLVVVNPRAFTEIPLNVATFVMAHELLHLALDTFSRESEFDDHDTINRAHDYVINDLLRKELGMHPPLGGLDLYDASELSLEKIVSWMNVNNQRRQPCWSFEPQQQPLDSLASGSMSSALIDAGLLPDLTKRTLSDDKNPGEKAAPVFDPKLDVIFPSMERQLFPDRVGAIELDSSEVDNSVRRCLAIKALESKISSIGTRSSRDRQYIEALKTQYRPPWEAALQRWMEAVAPGGRTYARPSRRGADRTDCVLPGRHREGWTMHIVLDTSGSMTHALASALGTLSVFCESVGVVDVHILQCDTEVTVDEWIPVESLAKYRITGFGGSDMSPGINQLSNDVEVTAAVVITDGWISYPTEKPPFHVLWALTQSTSFEPPYGTVIPIHPD